MKPTVPDSLKSTVEMLSQAFPSGVASQDVLPLFRLLYDHLSDRNLVQVLRAVAKRPEEVQLNSVYEAAQLSAGDQKVAELKDKLRGHGYDQWLLE